MAWPMATAGREHVRGLPAGERVPARVPPGHGEGAEEAAVEDAAALHEREQLARVARVVAPLDDEQQQLGAHQAGDEDVDGHVGDARRRRGPALLACRLATQRPARKARASSTP